MDLQMIFDQLKQHILDILISLGYADESFEVVLETPKEKVNGDVSTNTALRLAKVAKKAPKIIAQEIVSQLNYTTFYIKNVEIAGPGFINFYMDKSFLFNTIRDVLQQKEEYGSSDVGKQEKVNVEFVSANPTGYLHIGHARGAASGDSLCRVLKKAGYDVTREFYVNDAGNQITNLATSIYVRYAQLFGKDIALPADGYHGKEIIEIATKIKDEIGDQYLDGDVEYFRRYGVDFLLAGLQKDLSEFNVDFDVWFSEKSLYGHQNVQETVTYLIENQFTYEKDGATWLKTSEYGDEKDRVMIKSDGSYTYMVPDIAYHHHKINRGFTQLIDILGADHHGYVPRLKAAINMISKKADMLDVELLQMVRIIQNGEEIKLSKRSGKSITLRDLMDEVGSDAIRYFFAARSLSTHMDLDLDLALKKSNENPVYYAQYAHARICSIFANAEEKGIAFTNDVKFSTIESDKAMDLMSEISKYPQAIIEAAIKRIPHKITLYIQSLAGAFHSFYNEEKVVSDEIEYTQDRLALLKATQIILKDALNLIGVNAPEKM